MSYNGDDTSRSAPAPFRPLGAERLALGLPTLPPLPEVEPQFASHCACGAALTTDSEKGMERCAPCDARAFAKWDDQRRREADAALTTSCPSLTPALRAELLDAGLRPWQAVKVNACIKEWGGEPNNRMTAAGRTADLRARIIAALGAS